jgi:membrane protein DedA with SNARE-associated domain
MYELFLEFVSFVDSFGYLGIFIMTLIESTFIPIPAEVTLIPAGYLAQQGLLNAWLVWIVSICGVVCGSLINYYIAYHYGRYILIRYGKFFFINESKLAKIENFFHKHGAFSTFTGRLVPGVKHFISFPAGLSKMNLKKFFIYTALGGAIWCGIIIYLGYLIGENELLIKKYLKQINIMLIIFVSIMAALYIWKRKSNRKANKKERK